MDESLRTAMSRSRGTLAPPGPGSAAGRINGVGETQPRQGPAGRSSAARPAKLTSATRTSRTGALAYAVMQAIHRQDCRPLRRGGRVAEGGGLLNRYTDLNPYQGFESPPLRHFPCANPFSGSRPQANFLCWQSAQREKLWTDTRPKLAALLLSGPIFSRPLDSDFLVRFEAD